MFMFKINDILCFHIIQLCSLLEKLVVGLVELFAKGAIHLNCDRMSLKQFTDSCNRRNTELGRLTVISEAFGFYL